MHLLSVCEQHVYFHLTLSDYTFHLSQEYGWLLHHANNSYYQSLRDNGHHTNISFLLTDLYIRSKLDLQGVIRSLLSPRTWRRSLSFLTLFFIIANTHYNITSTRLPNTPAQYHLQQADHANIYVSTTPNNYRRQRQITYNHFHTFSFALPTFATLEQQYQTSIL